MDTSWIDPKQVRPLKRREYDHLVQAGVFEGERIELLHGFLYAREPQGPDHSTVSRRLHRLLLLALDRRADVQSHSPFAASDDSEPEPDVAVIPPKYSSAAHPSEAFLLVEIARTSLERDRGVKADLYASAGVVEYWVVDLADRRVEVRRQPENGSYQRLETFRLGEAITLAAFPDVTIAVADFLGP